MKEIKVAQLESDFRTAKMEDRKQNSIIGSFIIILLAFSKEHFTQVISYSKYY
jgi:hypothetical protein